MQLLSHQARLALAPLVFIFVTQLCLDAYGQAVRCKVTIEGFKVVQETVDHALEWDGKGDEIIVETLVDTVGQSGVPRSTRITDQIGDSNGNPHRITAGSRSSQGGLRTGDEYPGNRPQPQGSRSGLPMVVFNGMIQPGQEVIVTPVIIEWDGNDGLKSVSDLISDDMIKVALTAADPSLAAVPVKELRGLFGKAGNRPVGVGNDANDKLVFKPHMIRLNTQSVAKAAKDNVGLGPGVMSLDYQDSPDMGGGRYLLFVRIERL